MRRFEGQVVLVTGAGSGIGRAIAQRTHSEGAHVVAVDLDADAVQAVAYSLGERVTPYTADLRARGAVAALAADVLAGRGRVDCLFNNAGVSDRFTAALETTDEHWDAVLAINVAAAFFLSRAVLPSMLQQGRGSIVNTGSVASVVGGAGGAAYTASKHALVGLTKSLAFSYGPRGVRVNCVLPGAIRTAMTSSQDAVAEGADAAIAATPAGRWAEPEEVASVATFLASHEASFVHGSVYTVDGGWTLS